MNLNFDSYENMTLNRKILLHNFIFKKVHSLLNHNLQLKVEFVFIFRSLRRRTMHRAGSVPARQLEAAGLQVQRTVRTGNRASLRKRRKDLLQRVQPSTGGVSHPSTPQDHLQRCLQLR